MRYCTIWGEYSLVFGGVNFAVKNYHHDSRSSLNLAKWPILLVHVSSFQTVGLNAGNLGEEIGELFSGNKLGMGWAKYNVAHVVPSLFSRPRYSFLVTSRIDTRVL